MPAAVDEGVRSKRALKAIWGGVVAAAGCDAGYVALTYLRFGRESGQASENRLLDRLVG
jgi:hypothetical protein